MSARPTTMRGLRRVGIGVAVLVVLVGAGLWWLLGTSPGLHFVVARVTAASGGALSIESARGDLAGPFELAGIRYHDAQGGTQASIAHLGADPSVWSLLTWRLRFANLEADGIKVALTTPAKKPPASSPMSLKPPLNIVVDHAHVSDVQVTRDGKPLVAVNTLDLAGAWTSDALSIRELKLRAPAGRADLSGRIALGDTAQGKGHASFQWTLDDTTWAGTLKANSDGDKAQLTLALTAPMAATLRVNVQPHGDLPWTARLDAPKFDTQPILGDSSIKTLALALSGHGDRHGGTLTGSVGLNQLTLQLKPVEIHYDADAQRVTLDRLVLASPNIKGTLEGHGTVELAATPARADLALRWHDVVLPPSLAGQTLATAGNVHLTGSTERYAVKGRVRIGPPGKVAQLALDLTGTPTLVTLEHLTVVQPKGSLDAHGTVTLAPHLAWDLTLKGTHFNPGLLLAGWKGALDIDLATRGHLTPAGPDATFKLASLAGHLRQRQLAGHGTLHVTPNRVINGKLALTSGHSSIKLDAHGTARNHVEVDLAIRSLNDWLPDAQGALDGHVTVNGLWPRLAVDARLQGHALAFGEYRVDTLALTAKVPDISHPGGQLDATAKELAVGQIAFATLAVAGNGNAAHHTLSVAATGQPLSMRVDLTGGMRGKAWHGTLSRLDLNLQGLPPWRLAQPAALAWNNGKASLSSTCLTAGEPELCVSGQRARDGTIEASYRLQQIPLALVMTAVGRGLPLHSEGVVNGEGNVTRTATGALSGHATLASPAGKVIYPDRPELPLLAYTDFRAEATLAPQHSDVTLAATFADGGYLKGDVAMSGVHRALSGKVAMRLDNLAPVELFTTALANVKGHLDANVRLDGTLAEPVFAGRAALAQFAAEVPAVGLKLHDGNVTLATTGARQLRIDGHVASGKGTLQLTGTLGLADTAASTLHISGKNVLAADIPAASVVVSPDIAVSRDAKGLAITGSVTVDKARVELEKLPGAGATQASPDVVVVDAKQQPQEDKGLAMSADLTVNLGQQTHLIGYGLDGTVSGQLHVSQAPGKITTGRGQIAINGTFKAYGQDLVIKQGRLLFASTPIDNPGLDIRAVRALHPNATISDGQVVGLQMSGTAKRPVLTVFSNPAMEQSDALSYLITGKPLSQVRGGEGNLVDAAAQALGSAAGDLLAKNVGARLGIEASVSNSTALGTTAFTVGKYLSPRLYLSYGVGLFDPGQVITLRYILSARWNFEAEQATTFSRASLNYRLER